MNNVRTEYTLYTKYTFPLSLNSSQDTKEGRNGIKLINCLLFLAIPERSTVIKAGEALNERSPTKTNLVTAVGFNNFLTRGMCVTCLDYLLICFTCTVCFTCFRHTIYNVRYVTRKEIVYTWIRDICDSVYQTRKRRA